MDGVQRLTAPAARPAPHMGSGFEAARGGSANSPLTSWSREAIPPCADLYARYRRPEDGFREFVFRRLEVPETARILDVGCGPGATWSESEPSIPPGWRLTLLDRSAGMLRAARDRLAPAGRALDLIRADAQELPFRSASFDAVTAFHMLYDVADLGRGIREIGRVLVPSGTLFATTNGGAHLVALRELLRGLGVEGAMVEAPGCGRFDLEIGAKLLGRSFRDVRTFRQEGALEVTEVEPLLAYALSIDHVREQLGEAERRALRETVAAEIAARGCFRVTTDSGLLAARRPDRFP